MELSAPDVQIIFKDKRGYLRLTDDDSYDRFKLNQLAFEVAIDKDYVDIAMNFIENGMVQINWEMIRKMLANFQNNLVSKCIKFGLKFDPSRTNVKRIFFAGRTAQPIEDRTIRLVDFIQIMLELNWKTREIIPHLTN